MGRIYSILFCLFEFLWRKCNQPKFCLGTSLLNRSRNKTRTMHRFPSHKNIKTLCERWKFFILCLFVLYEYYCGGCAAGTQYRALFRLSPHINTYTYINLFSNMCRYDVLVFGESFFLLLLKICSVRTVHIHIIWDIKVYKHTYMVLNFEFVYSPYIRGKFMYREKKDTKKSIYAHIAVLWWVLYTHNVSFSRMPRFKVMP